MPATHDEEGRTGEIVLRVTGPATLMEDFGPVFSQLLEHGKPLFAMVIERGGEVRVAYDGEDVTDELELQ
ncbi:hypothetical protein ACIBCN_19050 [Nocardia sp. NPDC051052]|uniref:hypothetical protein n=1 Tax=Nocardia sp. NPDC051052 TaxID=3364322 RepID=UPI0037AB6BA6